MSASPRVLFVTHNFPRFVGDAAGSFVLELARALIDAGAHVHVLAPAADGLAPRDVVDGVPVERIRYASEGRQVLAYEGTMAEAVRSSWAARWALLGLLWHMCRAVRAAVDAAHRNGTPYDSIHAHWWFPAGVSAWLAGAGERTMPPMVVTLHGSDVRLAQHMGLAHPIMRRVLMRARAVTAVSGWLARTAEGVIPGVRVQIAPMPVPVERFVPRPLEQNARSGVLFVGRLNAQKGVADLLDALAQSELGVHCDVVGDGPDRDALHARAERLGLAHRITWHGALPTQALPALYRRAAMTVMPSREEGLGLVAVESQLCATPVIAYNSGGLPDVVSPTAGGTLVPVGDIGALRIAIDRLTRVPTDAQSSGERARTHMLEVFSPQRVAAEYLRLYANAEAGARG